MSHVPAAPRRSKRSSEPILPRQFAVVSGAPGAGKSTVATLLAEELQWPLLSKDVIKDSLFDSLGTGDIDWSKRLGAAAAEAVFALASHTQRAVLENFWRREHAYAQLAALDADVVEIYCDCPIDVARSRFAARATSDRHPGHHDAERSDDPSIWLSDDAREPLGFERLIVLDTTTPVDAHALATLVRSALTT